MREGMLCHQEGITINLFLIPSWSQSEEDIRFAYRLAESTKGRVLLYIWQRLGSLRGLGLRPKSTRRHQLTKRVTAHAFNERISLILTFGP